jgi:hypothetical protein
MLASTRCSQVVLTDLNDDWRLMWIDGLSVRMGKCNCRAQAVALIKSLVQQVGATGTGATTQASPLGRVGVES